MTQTVQIDWSLVFAAVADDSRREILRYLTENGERVHVTDLAGHLCGGEYSDSEEIKRISVGLTHVHLPKLDESGLISWDRQRDTVGLTDLAYHLPVGVVTPKPIASADSTGARQAGD
jgi:DNA-binding transcriptional ArsR family regulator